MNVRINRLLFVICLSTVCHTLLAQSSDAAGKTTVYDFVLLDTRYQSQYAFWGRNYGQHIPFASVNAEYYFHSNIWTGISGFIPFDNIVPEQAGLSIGFYKEFSPKSDWHTSYTQYFIPDSSVPTSSRTQGYLQTTLGLDWGILYSTLQAHLLVNENSDVFLTTYHSRYFEFNDRLWKKIKVSFEPKFSFTFGTHHFDFAGEEFVSGPGGGGAVPSQSSSGDGSSFKPLNWDFLFPLKFEAGKFSWEVSWRYTDPLNTAENDPSKSLHLFAAGIGYYIPVKRVKR